MGAGARLERKRLRALIVEDYEPDALLVIQELRHGEVDLDPKLVSRPDEIFTALTTVVWDLILTDWSIPGFGALEVLRIVGELGLDTPVIIVSGTITEDLAVSAMRAGARDFVLKDRLFRLLPAVERELREAEVRVARRRAERELREAAVRYRQLFELSPQPKWMFDLETLRILAVNDAAVRRYGYSHDEFLRMALPDLWPMEERDRVREDLALHQDLPRVSRHVTRRGEQLAVEITAHELEFEGTRACLVLANDVTERTRLEEQLRQSQKMEAIGRLAGGVAHDFNNILCVIMSYSETLLETLPPGELREDLEQIRNAGNRGAALTRQLLMFNRQQIVEPRALDLNEVLTDLGKMLPRLLRADIVLESRAAPELGQVWADQGSLEQVIMNLVVNARDAMPRGGTLTLETANVELDRAYAQTHLGVVPGRYVLLSVTDTGVGMSAATLAHIFEPFFTTKERGRGTGLGLSTVFGIVQQSHGHIAVESEPGTGTTFRVYLPRFDAIAEQPRTRRRPESLSGSETILLVEDDEQVRTVATTILRKYGYLVIAASGGEEALRRCEAHPGRVDLLLTDVVMPGMTGPELGRQLQRLRPEMRVLCMSGYTDENAADQSKADADIAYLQKPFTAEALAERVRSVLDTERVAVA